MLAEDVKDSIMVIASSCIQDYFLIKDETQIEIKCSRCKRINILTKK